MRTGTSNMYKDMIVKFASESSVKEAAKRFNISERSIRRWAEQQYNPMNCNICNQELVCKKELKKHLKAKHNEQAYLEYIYITDKTNKDELQKRIVA